MAKSVKLTCGPNHVIAEYENRDEKNGGLHRWARTFKYYSEARTWALDQVGQDDSLVTVIRPQK